jgi:hypothetical protein
MKKCNPSSRGGASFPLIRQPWRSAVLEVA